MKSHHANIKTELVFEKNWPHFSKLGSDVLFIFDKVLLTKSKSFKAWIAKAPLKYGVQAGECLKDIQHFANHIQKITALTEGSSSRNLTLCVIGGGSVGDFGGFVASILKRGVRLIHIPSTWLAALDSAHGGKTALNVGRAKNQIGTFYPAQKVYLIKELLQTQPEARTFEGFSELYKMALLSGGNFWKRLSKEKVLNSNLLWIYLPAAIEAKMKVVAKDPKEVSGHRHLLNFGHTAGHAFEALYQLPHGIAVNYGLDFALRWSCHRNLLSPKDMQRIQDAPLSTLLLSHVRDRLTPRTSKEEKEFTRLLLSDKKKTSSSKVRFVFLTKPGHALIEPVEISQILTELKRQSLKDNDGV